MPGSICDVLPAAAALLGVPGALDRLALTDWVGHVNQVDRVAVLLVDALGWHLLPELAAAAPLLASVLTGGIGRLDQLTCTFPSTTPTSLVSLGTGAQPGEHGILGFTLSIPGTDRVLNHVRWRDDPPHRQWQPLPTWFERLAQAGVSARTVLPEGFLGSGLTDAAYRGARFVPTNATKDYAQQLADELRAEPGLVYGYTAELDTAAHVFGIGSSQWHDAAAHVNDLLTRLVETLPRNAVLLVTADHGGLNVPDDARVDLDADPRLREGVRVVAGEPRVRYLHTQPGAAVDVADTWRELLDGWAQVYSRDQAVSTGLFGPVHPRHLPRIGDVVVVCTGDAAVLATGHEPPESARLIGFHGAATAAEMAIPLIVFTSLSRG
ncbi:alkaline phosphatase family protein [Mycobacterium haemophilum]|uniref:Nucleotide pyrophosphatase n=1 Tax=Mycobacterium haemophilum TaxID=29311 RepID=A0A0I9U188_9MYCO|nr:nucleotide pyrophosphatase/phosphodiesterase family protein [Mycobacterium haemophilum]KLO29245.1 nucleotide pyrophosphatase [Mycobacterium haemophilum]KLO35849.1 nucleotide pyrophosphatase [Mycobacterium haemophilum]KLO41370.1 nucleotide pyrophosphatase [Mycobacterium haemophilum]KLO49251.1 nucleotide pyrophosphatase [Mycobacterium haemophilum]